MKEIIPNLGNEDKTVMEKLLSDGHIKYKYARRLQIILLKHRKPPPWAVVMY